jgi:hypothetical protein
MNSLAATPRTLMPLTNMAVCAQQLVQMPHTNFGCMGINPQLCFVNQLPAGGLAAHDTNHSDQCCCHQPKDTKRKRFRKNDDQTTVMEN